MNSSTANKTHRGVIVPMVTPLTPDGALDEAAVGDILRFLEAGRVQGVFLAGTTGESSTVPDAMRERLVRIAAERTRNRTLVYAGINGNSIADSVAAGNKYLRLGADAVVAHVPAHLERQPQVALNYFTELASALEGDLILYNMPLTTGMSLPVELCKQTAGRPRVIGLKDSENNAVRMVEVLRELGDRKNFSIFIGTGPLMAKGLLLGAEGIVPSVGNLAPGLCCEMYASAVNGEVQETEALHAKMMAVSALYQNGRELGHSIATLKMAMAWMGLCEPTVLPPLRSLTEAEALSLRERMLAVGLEPSDSHRVPAGLASAC
jgi:4-hydroxy-tetrahydrodipicolinate synthase